MPYVSEHYKVGHLWARRTKTGKTILTGFFWYGRGPGKPKRVFTIRVSPNVKKSDPKQPDYIITDWTKEVRDACKARVYASYKKALEKR